MSEGATREFQRSFTFCNNTTQYDPKRFMSATHLHITLLECLQTKRLHYLNLLIDLFEHRWDDKRSLHSLDLLPCGPDIPQEDLFAFRVNGYKGDGGQEGRIKNVKTTFVFESSSKVVLAVKLTIMKTKYLNHKFKSKVISNTKES